MKNFIYVAACFVMMISCKPGVPADLIQPDKMALLLHDIHVFDGYISSVSNKDTATRIAASYYAGIYNKFDVDSALYQRSMTYYTAHPKVLDEIYVKVTSQIKKQRDKMVRADSLMNVKTAKTLKAKAKADSLKLKTDSIKKAESGKVEKERKKLIRQLDSLKRVKFSPVSKKKLRLDSIRKVRLLKKHKDSIKLVEKIKMLNKAKTIK